MGFRSLLHCPQRGEVYCNNEVSEQFWLVRILYWLNSLITYHILGATPPVGTCKMLKEMPGLVLGFERRKAGLGRSSPAGLLRCMFQIFPSAHLEAVTSLSGFCGADEELMIRWTRCVRSRGRKEATVGALLLCTSPFFSFLHLDFLF